MVLSSWYTFILFWVEVLVGGEGAAVMFKMVLSFQVYAFIAMQNLVLTFSKFTKMSILIPIYLNVSYFIESWLG